MKYLLSLACLLVFSISAWADDYYCVLFAPDSSYPKYCHVWGTFVQMKDNKLVKEVTISWAPANGWNCLDRKKPGYNMSLAKSMEMSGKRATCIWGPFVIKEDTFEAAEKRYESPGNYKMLDALSRDADNCIHRLSSISGKKLTTHVRYGKCAADSVYKHYQKEGLVIQTVEGEMILEALRLGGYKLKRMK